jgi:hypothetical protein
MKSTAGDQSLMGGGVLVVGAGPDIGRVCRELHPPPLRLITASRSYETLWKGAGHSMDILKPFQRRQIAGGLFTV